MYGWKKFIVYLVARTRCIRSREARAIPPPVPTGRWFNRRYFCCNTAVVSITVVGVNVKLPWTTRPPESFVRSTIGGGGARNDLAETRVHTSRCVWPANKRAGSAISHDRRPVVLRLNSKIKRFRTFRKEGRRFARGVPRHTLRLFSVPARRTFRKLSVEPTAFGPKLNIIRFSATFIRIFAFHILQTQLPGAVLV